MSSLPSAVLGRTGVSVSKLAYGAMELRSPVKGFNGRGGSPADAEEILNAVLDGGINLIDTSPDYESSEDLIGRFISHRRTEFFLASKCGCPVGAAAGNQAPHVFTRQNIRAGVEQSLRRMKTDFLDLVQFHHSPSRAELEENDSIGELVELQREGKVRFIGMSGVLPNLADHIAMGVFDAFQIPFSAVEREHDAAIGAAAAAGAGIIVRGGVARGLPLMDVGQMERAPEPFRAILLKRKDLWQRADLLSMLDGMAPMEFMLRFTLSHPAMTTTIVGTANAQHLRENLAVASKGPLPTDQVNEVLQRLSHAAGNSQKDTREAFY